MKNLVFNLRTAKAQAEGCATVTKSRRMAKVLTTLTLLLTLGVGQMWAGQGYNGESHVYLNVDGTTKYYKVSPESWPTGSSLPGTWGGVLKDQTFNKVLNIQIKGGAVGGWTENGGNISGNLYYKVTNNTTTPSSGWTTVGGINANYTTKSGNNCFRYKNDYSVNVTPTTPGTYYLHIKIVDGASTNRTSYVKLTVPSFTVAGSSTVLGSNWSATDTDNDMTFSSGTTYTLTKSNVTLSTGTTYECKVVLNHDWDAGSYPGSNKTFTVDANGHYNVTFSFNASSKAVDVSTTRLYAVIYNDNDKTSGSVPATSYHANGATVTVPSNSGSLAKTGYSFGGWNTNSSGTGTNYTAGSGTFTMGSSDKNLYAKWTQTVTLHDNNGGNNNGSATATYNKSGNLTPTAPTRAGYTVEGYYAEPECTNKVMSANGSLVNYTGYVSSGKWIHSGATTLYAKWTPIWAFFNAGSRVADFTYVSAYEYTLNITLNSSNASAFHFQKDGSTYYYCGADNPTSMNVTLVTGDGRLNWTNNGNPYGTYTLTVKSDNSGSSWYYRAVQEIRYSVTYDANGGTGTVTDASSPYLSGANVTVLSNSFTRTGYTFSKWNTAPDGSGQNYDPSDVISSISADVTLYAQWTAKQTTVTLDKQSGSGGPATVTATYGQAMPSATMPTRSNYTFQGYYASTGGSGKQYYAANGSSANTWDQESATKTIYAHWAETKYAVTVAVSDPDHAAGNIVCTAAGWEAGKSGTAQIGNLTNVTITVGAAAAGYKFDGGYWTLTGGVTLISGNLTDPSITVKATAAGSATYTYAEDLTSTYYVEGDASGPFTYGWNANANTMMMKRTGYSTSSDVYWELEVPASKTSPGNNQWEFKIYNDASTTNEKWYGWGNGTVHHCLTKANNNLTLSTTGSNTIYLKCYVEGTYTFHVNYSTPASPTLEVIWPVVNQLRISSANPADAGNTGNYDLVEGSDNDWSVSRNLNAGTTYTFKMVYEGDWYGKNSTNLTRASNSASALSTDGANMTIETDVAGSYTFTFNSSSKNLSVTYPAAYKLTYSIGDVAGTEGSISSSPSTSSGSYVPSGNVVTLTAPTEKTGYSWDGWYLNAAGTGDKQCATKAYAVTMNATKTLYACYTQDDYTITLNGNSGTGHTASVTAHYGEFAPVDDGVGGHKFSITNPNRDGYTFAGWYTNTDGTGTMLINPDGYLTWSIDGFTDGTGKWIATSGTTLYARWKTNASVGKYNFQYGSGTWYSSSWTLMNFGDADDHERTIDFTLIDPTSKKFFVGYDGDFQSVRIGEEGTAGASSEENLSNLRLAPGTLSVGSAIGATGKLVIFDNSSEDNLYVGFKPNGYGLTYVGGTKAFSEVSDHLWQTDIVTLTSSDVAGSFKVGLLTATPGSYVDCSTMTATDNAAALNTRKNALVTEQSYPAIPNLAAGQEGRFVIWDNDSHAGQQWYLCFLPVYSITYNDNGASSGSVPVDANKYRTNETPTVLGNSGSLAKEGYAFSGWNTAADGRGTAYTVGSNLEAIGDNVILYAQYRKAEITDVVLNAGIFNPVEAGDPETYVTADPTLDPTPAPTIKLCWELRYSNDNPVTGHDPIYVSGNQVKFLLNGLAAGGYKIHVELRTGSTCGAGTLLSSYDKSFSIASDHIVTVQYKCGDFTLKAPTSVGGKPLDWSEEITADAIDGYAFSSWTAGDGVTIKDAAGEDKTTSTYSTIQIKANYDGTLTANYTKKRMIYFNNTLGWESVYVYFYRNNKYWGYGSDAGKGTGSSTEWTKDATYPFIKSGAMTQIDGTDIWFYDCEANSVDANVENIVFTEYHQVDYTYFSYKYGTTTKNNVICRGDYKTSLPMFVPLTGVDPVEMNNKQANYYNEGYWMNYPENTGYTLKIYNSKTYGTLDELQSIPFEFTADKTLPMSLTVELNANKEYGFEIHRADGTTYGNNTKVMKINDSGDNADAWAITSGKRTGVKTSVAGDYIFTLNFGNNGGYNYLVGVHYPVAKGDYRILYQDLTTWSQSSAHTSSWSHPSRAIHKEDGAEDIVSFYVSKATGANASMKFQYASAVSVEGVVTWTDVTSGSIDLSGISASGVYNFYLTQSAGAISVDKIEAYTGKFYIRTDCAGSTKWENYRASDHEMPYTEFSMSDANSFGEKYSHYYTHWCPGGTNIKFVVANEYSSCISDTLESDLHNWGNLNDGGWLKHQAGKSETQDIYSANVRFMYNQETNKISRAYVASSTEASRLFLVLRGNEEVRDENSTAVNDQGVTNGAILSDKENWIYERILYIKPNSRFKLFACYAEASPTQSGAQYFRGAYDSDNFTSDANSVILISGSGSYQKARVLYDFKTNRLVCAWLPSDEPIDETLNIDADVMVIRDHQEAAECITFSGGSLTQVKTVYGAMKFNRWTLNNRYRGKGGVEDNNKDHCDSPADIAEYHGILPAGEQKSVYERSLYFISFPFDVKVSEIFGFGTYGKHWVLEYYDGLNRAKNGYWIDSPANWKYVTPSMAKTYELKAYEGYILCLSLGRMAYDNTEIWPNNISNVELYFPSKTPMTNIQTTDVNISGLNEIAGDPYRCTIYREGEDGDRRVKDSYWRCLGVPSYDMYAGTLTSDGSTVINWQTDYSTFPFLYAWNMNDNTLTPQSTNRFSFKPMHAYLTQIGTAIHWTNVNATPAVMARQTEEPTEYNWCLTLNAGEQMIDQTYVRMSTDEVITNEFDFGQDLSKELNTGRSDIYSFIGNERAAANSMQMNTETTTIVPLGLNIEATGDYTFSIPDGTNGIGITLIDEETGIRTSLSALDYTVELAAGDYTERFWLEISPVKGTETGIDPGVDARENGVRKVMIDGLLYIVRDGKMYDATGKRVE